ncbi:MAG TPA: hypothetical protein VEB88_03915 [Candidatus Acidoferrales bacterium]|nr:hypothetical protein [Candidatus Acidoferrales bacterium]
MKGNAVMTEVLANLLSIFSGVEFLGKASNSVTKSPSPSTSSTAEGAAQAAAEAAAEAKQIQASRSHLGA